jgi:hypothetical protein
MLSLCCSVIGALGGPTVLTSEGYAIQTEDIARLSPLVFEHINLLGRYAFSVPDSVVRGQVRSLRNPADALEDIA